MSEDIVVLKRRPYEPWVSRRGRQLIFHLPVESGFASLHFEFAITAKHLAVLEVDVERFYFLFAVLHWRYQMQAPAPAPVNDRHVDRILFEPRSEVERLLTQADGESNGAVSNHVRLVMGRDQSAMRRGIWFKDP